MSKNISKIIAGVSIIGCFGIFLPNQILAKKHGGCPDISVERCTKNTDGFCKVYGYCSGPKSICDELPERTCKAKVGTCKWGREHCGGTHKCREEAYDNKKACKAQPYCMWVEEYGPGFCMSK